MLLILLDKRREPGVGLGRIEREGLLRNVLQHTVEPELPHLGHVVRAGLPAAVVVLATAVHHIDLLFAVAVDDTLQADGSDLPLDIVVLQVYDDKRFGRGFDFRIEPARQVDVRSGAAAARTAVLARSERHQTKQGTETIGQSFLHEF